MKKLFILVLISVFSIMLSAQPPQKLSYQAVIRNSTGGLVTNHAVGMKISILQGTSTGAPVYVETHTPTTNVNGLATIEIGGGSVVSGTFATINWSGGIFYIKTETDLNGGTSYTITGTSQLLSVPYALYSNSANGFTLPYSGSGNTSGGSELFYLKNLGTGRGMQVEAGTNTAIWGRTAGGYAGLDGRNTTGYGVYGSSDSGDGIHGLSNSGNGVYGEGAKYGVYGKSTATTGDTRGISGESLSVSGSGVYGKSPKYGVFGEAVRTTGIASIYGVFGKTDDAKGYGVYGQGLNGGVYAVSTAETGSTYGIIGITQSPSGTGVSGSSAYQGMYGVATGNKGRGVMGEATGTNSVGLLGRALNDNSTGVWGEGANQGVYGKSDMATGKGVFGQVSSATGYSGYFNGGKFYVSGDVGIGTTSPAKKLHVNGSAQVKDTLFAKAVSITNSPRVFYKKSASSKTITAQNSWGPLDTITVQAPGPGYVILNFSGELSTNHTYLDNT